MKFKKGDKIKLIEDYPGYYGGPKKDMTGTILSISSNILIKFDNFNTGHGTFKDEWFVDKNQIELINNSVQTPINHNYQIGDIFNTGFSTLIIVDIDYRGLSSSPYMLQDFNNVGPNNSISRYGINDLNRLTYAGRDVAVAKLFNSSHTASWTSTFIPGITFDPKPIVLDQEHGVTFPTKACECDCGTKKVYGENAAKELHSSWCSINGK